MAGFGAAYRLGGDEFCAHLELRGQDSDGLILRAASALSETGVEFAIRASLGVALLPHEADSADHALQVADERMYADKRSRSTAARTQAGEVLLRTMHAKQPELDRHSSNVAELAARLARRLGVGGEAVDEIARAAELHDIGKVGIPDAILNKASGLSAGEWQFIHQHTILGERILRGAPALRPVARLVRASHERWDGDGYPDGLHGEEIPPGARIVSVCDAYEAMTAHRSYRSPVPTMRRARSFSGPPARSSTRTSSTPSSTCSRAPPTSGSRTPRSMPRSTSARCLPWAFSLADDALQRASRVETDAMRSERMLVLFEPGRGGAATIDLARELAQTRRVTLTVVGVAPQAASGSRCGNSALEFNAIVAEAVAKDLDHARERLGPVGAAASYEVLVEGTEPSLERFAGGGGFDIVLLPARRGLLRPGRHPAADRLRRVTTADVRVISDRSGQARGSGDRSPLGSRTE